MKSGLITGTAYFVSLDAARQYYQPYEYPIAKEAVDEKLRTGEIHIGKPPERDGETIITVDGGLRYAYELKGAAA